MVNMRIKRPILNKLLEEFTRPEIVILLGARQAGKTTLLKMLAEEAQRQGRKAAFFDLEQPQVIAGFNKSDGEIIEMIKNAGEVVFIDEFQYIKNISKILKAIYDSGQPIKIFCSGSSSLEIHKHLKESMAGRRLIYRIYPLSFSELRNGIKELSLGEYLKFGGMPGLLTDGSEERKQKILSELLASYILKDARALIKEENVRAFNHLLYLMAEKQGSIISVNSLSREIGLSPKAINRYLDILEETYINYRLHSYSRNLGNELKKSVKTYLYDIGIRNTLLKDFSSIDERDDKGTLFESAVFLKLFSELEPNMELKFWRTKDGAEVDFVILKNRKPYPIEVKSNVNGSKIPPGMKRFLSKYKEVKTAYIVNNNLEKTENWEGREIIFVKLENFLLRKFELS